MNNRFAITTMMLSAFMILMSNGVSIYFTTLAVYMILDMKDATYCKDSREWILVTSNIITLFSSIICGYNTMWIVFINLLLLLHIFSINIHKRLQQEI